MRLNRRHFIGGMVAAAAAPRFASGETAAVPHASAVQGRWMGKGLVDAGGNHEPYIFIVRRGGQRLDAKQTSDGGNKQGCRDRSSAGYEGRYLYPVEHDDV